MVAKSLMSWFSPFCWHLFQTLPDKIKKSTALLSLLTYFLLAFVQAEACFYANASILASCYNQSLDLVLWVNNINCIPPRYPQFGVSLTNGSAHFEYIMSRFVDIEVRGPITIKGIPLTNVIYISDTEYRNFLLRVTTGIVTITDTSVSEFAATYTLKKVDILCSNYSYLWAQAYLIYNLPKSMGGNPDVGPSLCVETYGPIGTFPESSLLYFSANIIVLSELSGTTITVPVQRGKLEKEFRYRGRYHHETTHLFCYNCSIVSVGEKDFCEKLVSKFASLDLHITALQLSSKYERTTKSLPTIEFHVHHVIDNYYNHVTEEYQYHLDTNYFPTFIAENGVHFVTAHLNYLFIKPLGSTYSDVSFIFYSLDDYHLKTIYLKLSYSYVHPITSSYFWLLIPKDAVYNQNEMASLALSNNLKGELVVRHMNSKGQIQLLEIAQFSTMVVSCFGRPLVTLHQSSISILLNLSMTPEVTMECLIANANRTNFVPMEQVDNSSALHIAGRVQIYTMLYYFPHGSDINRDMHLIGAFVISTEVSMMASEVTMSCTGNWIGYSEYNWPMSCLYQLNQARHHMMNGDLRAVIRVHNDYEFVDTFAYDEIRSAAQFIYILMIVSSCCMLLIFLYYCITLCKFYRRLLR